MDLPSNTQAHLPVPSVQELAREPLDAVPSRYIRDDVDDPVSNPCNPSLQIPTVDMSRLLDAESQTDELHKLYSICRDWGAFQLVNHGVADELVKSMKEKIGDFFNFPLQEKKRYAQKEGSVEGYGQTFVTSEEQKLEWNDMLFIHALPIEDRNYSFWPERPQGFRETLDSYSGEVKRLAISLLEFMAKGLGLEVHEFSKHFNNGQCHVRMNYYPHCSQPQQVIGMAAHADISGITILLELDETQGLQIRKDGYWVPVEILSGAFLIFVGNIGMECRTQSRCK
ncbi:oxoglutarate-dependent flavonoid 7-O-demethylase 1-like isoform X2 [Magnolia sinica]|uniref:oxoglutarate-dependent flavonoid 7-O-demethylase 1-like isoform X2 n=1 Tax=Magnolia sinica TaxID=86752 RepID=UPI00265A2FD5|nr:oxoglutarate-dependent flavonoid 7-O-demethylase 1-like isoform X2 [Magnolia sinica]